MNATTIDSSEQENHFESVDEKDVAEGDSTEEDNTSDSDNEDGNDSIVVIANENCDKVERTNTRDVDTIKTKANDNDKENINKEDNNVDEEKSHQCG